MDNKMIIDGLEYSHSEELQEMLDNLFAKIKEEIPSFPFVAPFTKLKEIDGALKEIVKFGDESLDELIGASGYKVSKSYLKEYIDELEKFGVDEVLEFIGMKIKHLILAVKEIGDLIINNNERPIFIQNRILYVLTTFNEVGSGALVFQVLYLQGILKWLEFCDINEGDPGYEEGLNLCNWVYEKFEEACFHYFLILRNDNVAKPLTEYLKTLEFGKACSDHFNMDPVNSNVNENNSNQKTIISNLSCELLFQQFKDIYPSENKDSWKNRFVDDPEQLEPLKIGNNIVEIVGMLDAIHEVNVGDNPDKFADYVYRRWGIKHLSRKKGDHRDKKNYKDAKKHTEDILKNYGNNS